MMRDIPLEDVPALPATSSEVAAVVSGDVADSWISQKTSWIRTAADRTAAGASNLKATLQRYSVDPVSLAATKALEQTRKIWKQDGIQATSDGFIIPGEDDPTRRQITLDGGQRNQGFAGNKVITAKYNFFTFPFIFLFEMFSRVAYLYFLVQAILSWWRVVSPFGGYGPTLAIAFVLIVGAIKAIIEDRKRYLEDRKTNSSIAHVVDASGKIRDIQWTNVEVGHVLLVRDDELIPADLLCLATNLPENVCFVKTVNLDGETNLKIRKPIDLRDVKLESLETVMRLVGRLSVEAPNANLHHLKGTFYYQQDGELKKIPVTMNEMLLRGCMLKNSGFVLGMVVYTGPESRIQMNAARTPYKMGSFDSWLNVQVGLMMILQFIMCLFGTVASLVWKNRLGMDRYYLALNEYVEGNYRGFGAFAVTFITFWLLNSYLVPLSLFVTMEVVKFWQGFVFINADPELQDPVTKEYGRTRNSNLNEDLGKVEYVFSDKTGTLTGNEMQLRGITVRAEVFGNLNWKIEEHPNVVGEDALEQFDSRLLSALHYLERMEGDSWFRAMQAGGSSAEMMAAYSTHMLSQHPSPEELIHVGTQTLDFWFNVCLCHSLIVENNPRGGPPLYQGPSPDEVALVEAARQLGFEFVARSMSEITLKIMDEEVRHEILNMVDFTSERGRMSVIARAPDGTIRLFCKGADSKLLPLLRKDTDPVFMQQTLQNLSRFAVTGLRTLLLTTRIIPEEEFQEWDARFQEASSDMDNREGRVALLAEEMEKDMTLVGMTAIEDKLQDGVPEAIATLQSAGMKVWMITGDKQETAINIGISCNLVNSPDSLMICNSESYSEARGTLAQLALKVMKQEEEAQKTGQSFRCELVIDGKTLTHVLGTENEEMLAEVASRCNSVIICRASPSQKALIVRMMREYELKKAEGDTTGLVRWWLRRNRAFQTKMLAIGDGANDVAMIQSADIGVGIMGKEGRQAVNNSDYAIAQFRFLVRLLLVHGTLSHYRCAQLIKYSFYKNICFGFVLFFFQFFNGYSGQTIIAGIPAAVYNVIFTALPILLFSLLDRPVQYLTTLLRYPQLYNKQQHLSTFRFWVSSVLMGIMDGALVFFLPFYAMSVNGKHTVTDVFSLGVVVYIGLVGVISIELCLVTRYWTKVFTLSLALCYFSVFLFVLIYPPLMLVFHAYAPVWQGQPYEVLGTAWFWFSLISMYAAVALLHGFSRVYSWLLWPQDTMILMEKERLEGPMGGQLSSEDLQRITSLMSLPEAHSNPLTGGGWVENPEDVIELKAYANGTNGTANVEGVGTPSGSSSKSLPFFRRRKASVDKESLLQDLEMSSS